MKKTLLGIAITISAVAFYYTPYLTLKHMREAAKNHDAATLNSYIDYPALRESLKTSLSSSMSHALLKNKTDSGMNAFATMFAAAFVNPMVDTLITSNNVSLMLRADLPNPSDSHQHQTEAASNEAAPDDHHHKDIVTSGHYQDFNHFVATVAKKENPQALFSFTFERDGLVSWKLKGLTIPPLGH